MNNVVFVSGAAGFIGSNMVERLLKKNVKVIGLDNFDNFYNRSIKEDNIKSAVSDDNYQFIEGDIRDKDLLNKIFQANQVKLVIHLAAKAGVRPSMKNPEEYYSVNVEGTLNILESMKANDIKKMIFASSSSVYGNNDKIPFSEMDNVDFPISPYAATKKAGELMCHTYHSLYDIDVFCLRFFTVYGRRQRPDLAIHKFTNLILNDKPIDLYGEGESSRDYTYIDDILDGIESAIDNLRGYQIINLGESSPITLKNMITVIEEALNKESIKNYLPMQPGDVSRTYADIAKAKELLNYYPKTLYKDGIKEFIKWKINQ